MWRCFIGSVAIIIYGAMCTSYSTSSFAQKSKTISNLECGIHQTILLYGTSLTISGSWVEQISTILYNRYKSSVSVINIGCSGKNSQWGLENVREMVFSKKPDCVFIEFAINDVVTMTREESQSNMNSLIDSISTVLPASEIVLMTMNPRSGDSTFQNKQKSFYEIYNDIAQGRSLLWVDNNAEWNKLKTNNYALYEAYIPDGCHPTAKGNEEVVTPTILTVLGLK
jgi:acyl-CoA thioesterase I